MSDIELITFTENTVTVTVFIDDEEGLAEMRDVWENKVQGCQAPLVGAHKNGFSVFIPWILKPLEEEKEIEEHDT